VKGDYTETAGQLCDADQRLCEWAIEDLNLVSQSERSARRRLGRSPGSGVADLISCGTRPDSADETGVVRSARIAASAQPL
jgi:hypothetical protein